MRLLTTLFTISSLIFRRILTWDVESNQAVGSLEETPHSSHRTDCGDLGQFIQSLQTNSTIGGHILIFLARGKCIVYPHVTTTTTRVCQDGGGRIRDVASVEPSLCRDGPVPVEEILVPAPQYLC